VDRAPDRELGDRDHALRLVADVDEHLVLVHPHDLAVDDLALVDRREGGVVVGDELAVRTGGPDAVARDWLLCLGSHLAADQYSQGPFSAPGPFKGVSRATSGARRWLWRSPSSSGRRPGCGRRVAGFAQ